MAAGKKVAKKKVDAGKVRVRDLDVAKGKDVKGGFLGSFVKAPTPPGISPNTTIGPG